MKLSLRINSPEDETNSGTNDDTSGNSSDYPDIKNYNFEAIAGVLEKELVKIYPPAENYEFAEISLTFMNADEIRELNKNYRDTDEATDVLSFPLNDSEPVGLPELPVLALGDIVICPEETERLHPELSQQEAICLMIAHSFLHLLGFDHDTEAKQADMWERQEKISREILGVSQ